MASYFFGTHMSVSLNSLCPNFINVKVQENDGPVWHVAFVYGEHKVDRRHMFWNHLHFLKAQWKGPWVCMGDFNEVLYNVEQLGANDRGEAQMCQF